MAISANAVIELRTTGSDTNGGGFVSGASGTDFSQQDAAQFALTNGVTNGTTTIGTVSAAASMVGNLVYVAGGTGSVAATWYQIISAVVGTSITVDRSTGLSAGTGVTLNIGGAIASIGTLGKLTNDGAIPGGACWQKSGTYTLTSASSNVSGGTCSIYSFAAGFSMEGYQTTRGDMGTMPLNSAGAITGITIMTGSGSRSDAGLRNINFDGANGASNNGVTWTSSSLYGCSIVNCPNTAVSAASAVLCIVNNCGVAYSARARFCKAVSCTTGYMLGSANCLAISCTNGFGTAGTMQEVFSNCTAVSCTNAYLAATTAQTFSVVYVNCLAIHSSGTGFAGSINTSLVNCAAFSNLVNFGTGFASNVNPVTCTAEPLVDYVGGNYAPNASVGGGALLRGASISPYGQTGYLDIGAVQHQDTPASVTISDSGTNRIMKITQVPMNGTDVGFTFNARVRLALLQASAATSSMYLANASSGHAPFVLPNAQSSSPLELHAQDLAGQTITLNGTNGTTVDVIEYLTSAG